MKIAAIDFETANRYPSSVCAIGVAIMEDGKMEEPYYSLIRPEENVFWFDAFNTRIHGIRYDDVLDAPSFNTVYEEVSELTEGALFTAHNARFDMTCLAKTCRNVHMPVPDLMYFDTLALSRRMFPEMAHHRLNDMCERLDIPLNHHNACSDATGALMIVQRAMEMTGIWDIDQLLCHFGLRKRGLY